MDSIVFFVFCRDNGGCGLSTNTTGPSLSRHMKASHATWGLGVGGQQGRGAGWATVTLVAHDRRK